MHGFFGDIEFRRVDVAIFRQIADRRVFSVNTIFTAIDDPAQNAQVLAKARPQEVAIVILAEPVNVEDSWQLVAALLQRQPVLPVIGKVVAAEWLHRHRVAADDADFTNRGRGRLGAHTGADKHAMFPVLGFVNERRESFATAAEDDG